MSDAIIKACNIVNTPKNTGKQCDTAMVATAMLIAMQRGLTFTLTDLQDPVGWLTTLIHQKKAFPLFGQKAPIREINNDTAQDIIVELDDGLKVFLRYGLYNRNFATTSGGLCYAEALQSFLNSGYDIIEIDQAGQLLARNNKTAVESFSPLITDFMFSPAPVLPDFKTTPYKNRFSYSFTPLELVQNGIIFKGAQALLSMMGLIDAKITKAAAATTTKLKIGVIAECSEGDLIPTWGADLADPTNFLVVDLAAPTVPITISAAAVVTGWIELTGTFTTAHIYRVVGTSPATWFGNDVEGYDGSENYVDILIP